MCAVQIVAYNGGLHSTIGAVDNTVGSQKNLTHLEEAVIIGAILGDGCLERHGRYVRLKIGHGPGQKAYLVWKHQLLERIALKVRFVNGAVHYKTGIRYHRFEFATRSTPQLETLWKTFCGSGKKEIPSNINQILKDPLSLAIWFMDDGYKRSDCKALRLNTDSFSLEHQKKLQLCLQENFGIHSAVHKKGSYWNLYIPGESAEKLSRTIAPFVTPSMRYKIFLDPVETRFFGSGVTASAMISS